ncbi:MAG: VCBS repeat-containing protein [Candidatus Hydrogenedentes bacterium]|nr:VCBS repeat-containing protein [Candidatus Hydrogenedentota bacterium]
MKVAKRFAAACVLCALLAHAPEGRAAEPRLYQLAAPVDVWDADAEDLNGDGRKELFALLCDSKTWPYRKSVALYEGGPETGFSAQPDHVAALPEETGVVFFSEQTGQPPRELIAAHAAGAVCYTVSMDGFQEWKRVDFNSILPTQTREPLFLKKLSVDLDRDGIEEWLLPTAAGHQLYTSAGLKATIPSPMISSFRGGDTSYITYQIPAFDTFDLGGDGPLGIGFANDEFADFSHGPGWEQHWRFTVPHALDEKWESTVRIDDINGDRFPDLMITQTQGTINLESRTQIYVSGKPFSYPASPTAEFSAKGATTSPALADVNGDELLDVIVVRIPFGVANMVSYLVRGKVSVNLEIYAFDGKKYSETPAFTTDITMDAPDGREQVAYTIGDFNNDKKIDIAYAQGENSLALHQGDPARFLSDKPWLKLEVPSFGVARAFKLDGEGSDDIVLFHPSGPHSKRIDVILFE